MYTESFKVNKSKKIKHINFYIGLNYAYIQSLVFPPLSFNPLLITPFETDKPLQLKILCTQSTLLMLLPISQFKLCLGYNFILQMSETTLYLSKSALQNKGIVV